MIRNFRHNGLRRFWERGEHRRVPPEYADKIDEILGHLDEAYVPDHMNRTGYGLHPLRGNLAGYWSVRVSGNWRIIFRFEDGSATDVDFVDYH